MNLFDRIPHGLFAALTGRNNRRAWDLLVRNRPLRAVLTAAAG